MKDIKKPIMGFKEIIKIIPHQHPFIFIDKVLEKNLGPDPKNRKGSTLRAVKNVTINEPFFQGHFPHRPVLPAVFLLEILAQAGALLCYKEGDPRQDVAFAGVNGARFRRAVVPGDRLDIQVDCRKDKSSFLVFGGEITVEGELVCEAEIIAKVFDMEKEF